MVVIFGVFLSLKKKLIYALPLLYGIGLTQSKKICNEFGFSPNLCVKDLTEKEQFLIVKKLKENFAIEGNLKEIIKLNIEKYIQNGSFRGFRHKNSLPVRGQRTRTNARTARRLSIKKN